MPQKLHFAAVRVGNDEERHRFAKLFVPGFIGRNFLWVFAKQGQPQCFVDDVDKVLAVPFLYLSTNERCTARWC